MVFRGINFGIRQSFDNLSQVEGRFRKLDVPVELALPYYWDIYSPVRKQLPQIAGKIKSYGTRVISVHAVQAPITDKRFKEWGKETAEFAAVLNAGNITLHPNKVNGKARAQSEAVENIRYLSEACRETVFSIETFESTRRVFNADEIADFNLPMTLDVSHIPDDGKIWRLLKNYRHNIPTVHLSAREGAKQHLPIDDFCRRIVSYLIKSKWKGNIILEYLFEFRRRLLNDLEFLRSM
ncbi:MAG: sugar phosphate isomerase/epimerase family protein [Actinomycetota bacterium]